MISGMMKIVQILPKQVSFLSCDPESVGKLGDTLGDFNKLGYDQIPDLGQFVLAEAITAVVKE